jgi:hypothetical protein
MHPISLLQGALVTALRDDDDLVAMVGSDGVFDAAPKARPGPYVVIARHDAIQRDGDETPGQEHRLLLHCWSDQPSRKLALEMAERLVSVGLVLDGGDLTVTHCEHVRTETVIDRDTGHARAAVSLRFFSE